MMSNALGDAGTVGLPVANAPDGYREDRIHCV